MGRLGTIAATALLALAAVSSQASSAAAEIVPNPDPSLIAEWAPCEPKTGVTLIVDRRALGDQKIYVRCAPGPQPNGVSALLNAGFDLDGAANWGLAFICRIDGQPTLEEEACLQTPGGDRYWSYWNGRAGGSWNYSGVGAGNELSASKIDDVQGWSFGSGGPPRILPMHGAGPQAFELPPAQESSTIPSGLAREWLTRIAVETAEQESAPGPGVAIGPEERLPQVISLARAGVPPSEIQPAIALLFDDEEPGEGGSAYLQGWGNPALALGVDPDDPEFPLWASTSRYALAITGVAAVGGDPTDVEGADLRGELIAKIDETTGKIRNRKISGIVASDALGETTATVEALALSGALPPKALQTVDLILAKQDPDSGALSAFSGLQVEAIRALAAARGSGAGGLAPAIQEAGEYLATLQEPDGGIRLASTAGDADKPTFASTAAGAVGLALAGEGAAAEAAAKWVSRFQVTAEYAGTPDPVTGDPGPAEGLIGAFLGNEADLRRAFVGGISPSGEHGPYPAAQLPTAEALEALGAAGPYGPHSASLSHQSLWFGKRTLGTQGTTQVVTLTNEDERSLSVAAASLAGEGVGDFVLDGADCLGRTLTSGQGCELAASFAPTAVGVREAVVLVELTGSGQTLEFSLGGTGFPAPVTDPEPRGDPDPLPTPELIQAPAPPRDAAAILPFKNRAVTGRVFRVARLSCPAGAPCQVKSPQKVWVKIAGTLYRGVVLAPASLDGGASASVGVRLSRRALAALAAHGATVELKVEILTAGGAVTRTVKVRIAAAPSRASRRLRSPR